MIDRRILSEAQRLFRENKSITTWLHEECIDITEELIGMVYELQAGSYSRRARENPKFVKAFASEVAAGIKELSGFAQVSTILDCGTGEGTTLLPLMVNLDFRDTVMAFDGSLSRVSWAQENSKHMGNFKFFVADTSSIPLQDNAIDLVLSVHALEPNGGREDELILELARVSSRYVVLVEPDFESSSKEQQARMNHLGYIKGLGDTVIRAGLTVLEKRPMISEWNSDNAASLWLCEKKPVGNRHLKTQKRGSFAFDADPKWADPVSRETLEPFLGCWRSPSGVAYPIVNGIPILRPRDGIMFLSPPTLNLSREI